MPLAEVKGAQSGRSGDGEAEDINSSFQGHVPEPHVRRSKTPQEIKRAVVLPDDSPCVRIRFDR